MEPKGGNLLETSAEEKYFKQNVTAEEVKSDWGEKKKFREAAGNEDVSNGSLGTCMCMMQNLKKNIKMHSGSKNLVKLLDLCNMFFLLKKKEQTCWVRL